MLSLVGGAVLADDVPVYPTSEACYAAQGVPCHEIEGGWTPHEEIDTSDVPGTVEEYDQENLHRQHISMPTNISGTLDHPIVAVDMTQVIFPDVQPYLDLEIGRVRVPIRFIAEQMGAQVNWENETQTVTILREGLTIQLRVDDPVVIANGLRITIDAPPRLVDPGRVMVPLRFISEAFGASVDWVGTEPPHPRDTAWGKYQVWVWVDWGYWGKYTLNDRLHVYGLWFYRGHLGGSNDNQP
jgi:hypothetical protein